ncbi:tripartite motif-containing protein 5-like isoform X2 [Palaemon carinicauda]|uniref:tripartite motif-containing protein 5-like isoform X2 n=1 Tax=Palaemon carinicauda TaxID=392227 RepID=UPI0035B5A91A
MYSIDSGYNSQVNRRKKYRRRILSTSIDMDSNISQNNVISGKNCAVCFGSYTVCGRRPRSLPCGHTFCTKCIACNLREGTIICPSCRVTYDAESPSEFPINFGLENVLQEFTSSDSFAAGASSPTSKEGRCISKKLRSLRQELLFGVEELSKTSRGLNLQLNQYDHQLGTWKEDHLTFTTQLEDMVKAIDKESQRVKDAIQEEEDERKKMESARDHLTAVSSTKEILVAVEDVNLCREDLENWIQRANENFPNVEIVTKSKELRERYKIEPLKIVTLENGETSSAIGPGEDAGSQCGSSPSTSRIADLESATLENQALASSLSVQDKIENTLDSAIFWRESKAVQTDDALWRENHGQLATSSNAVIDFLTSSLNVKHFLKSTLSMFFQKDKKS